MKSQKITAFLFIACFLLSTQTFAEILRWPQTCPSGKLFVFNQSANDISGWLQKFDGKLISETENLFKAKSLTTLNISTKNSSEFYSIFYFEGKNSLIAQLNCDTENKEQNAAHAFEGGVLTFKKSDLSENKIWLQNLFSAENIFTIELLDQNKNSLSTFALKLSSLEQLNYKLSSDVPFQFIRVKAENRFTVFNLSSVGSSGPISYSIQQSEVPDTAAYFVVGPRDSDQDQFVVSITAPALIQKAREQITNPSLEKIVFAKVEKGHGGFNRNWSKKEKSFWSWHTTEVTNISDLGSTACNGIPQALEDRVDSWIDDPGRICFWSYRIKKELSPKEVSTGYP